LNGDGVIDYNDYQIIGGTVNAGTGSSYGNPLMAGGSPLAVPEPATLSLMALSAGMLLNRRSQKRK
jgi:hypothetical protein